MVAQDLCEKREKKLIRAIARFVHKLYKKIESYI